MHTHTMVPDAERVGAHACEIAAYRSFDGFDSRKYPDQSHDPERDDHNGQYRAQKVRANGHQRNPDVFNDQ